jgi:hypothetical protein
MGPQFHWDLCRSVQATTLIHQLLQAIFSTSSKLSRPGPASILSIKSFTDRDAYKIIISKLLEF